MPEVVLAAVELEQVLVVGAILFAIGLYVALSKRNAVGVLMGVELMLNAVNVPLLAFARFVESPRRRRPQWRLRWRWRCTDTVRR